MIIINMKSILLGGIIGGFVSTLSHAQSITQDITFSGNVPVSCAFGSSSNGTLFLDTNTNVLSSINDGSIEVTTNGGALLSVSAPDLVGNSPDPSQLNTANSTATLSSGSTTITNTDGFVTLEDAGTETFDVAVALTSNNNTFIAGDYVAQVTVTCEFEATQVPGF